MRIIEQIQATVLGLTDQFVIDGSIGTRAISFENLLKAINEKIGWASLWGENIPVPTRRNIWRGKNLGTVVTQAQWDAIADGSFKGLFLGDYWIIEDRVWRIVDFDYWWGTGDTACATHHLVIMPDHYLYAAKMNNENSTAGGYVGSKMYTENLANAKSMVNGAFGSDHILNHRELLTNAVSDGAASGGSWYNSTVEIPNEIMIYGTHIIASYGFLYTIDKTQLAGMRISSESINQYRSTTWLRDIRSEVLFGVIGDYGHAAGLNVTSPAGVRPVFGIKG